MSIDPARPYNVLFLCTGNSARSLLAEATLSRLGAPRFRSYSAGSQPKEVPHAMALETLSRRGYETTSLRCKSWDEFAKSGSPEIDLVLTVCDNVAAEACPIWSAEPLGAYWGVRDPAAFRGSSIETRAFFELIHDELTSKIEELVRLEPALMSAREFGTRLVEIGKRS